MKLVTRVGLIFLMAALPKVQAEPITYDIDRAIGDSTVSGSLTTDGTIGVLEESNIVDWLITITIGEDSLTFGLESNTTNLRGEAVTATDTELSFDPTKNEGFLNLQRNNAWWQICGGVICSPGGGTSENARLSSTTSDFIPQLTAFVFASRESDSGDGAVSVPEPGTLGLLGAGLIGIGFARRRNKAC